MEIRENRETGYTQEKSIEVEQQTLFVTPASCCLVCGGDIPVCPVGGYGADYGGFDKSVPGQVQESNPYRICLILNRKKQGRKRG